jgi:hypothetical protein
MGWWRCRRSIAPFARRPDSELRPLVEVHWASSECQFLAHVCAWMRAARKSPETLNFVHLAEMRSQRNTLKSGSKGVVSCVRR